MIDAIKELEEDRCALLVLLLADVLVKAVALSKLVAKRDPLLLDEHSQATHSAIVMVETQLSESNRLAGAIPAIRTTQII